MINQSTKCLCSHQSATSIGKGSKAGQSITLSTGDDPPANQTGGSGRRLPQPVLSQEMVMTTIPERRESARDWWLGCPPGRWQWLWRLQDSLSEVSLPGRQRQRILAIAASMAEDYLADDPLDMRRWVDMPALARKYGMSGKSVYEALYWLTDQGWLVIANDPPPIIYRLIVPRQQR
jgi:hypothetical protein